MTTADKVIKTKVGLLELGKQVSLESAQSVRVPHTWKNSVGQLKITLAVLP
jgi:hypothetical protein